MIDIFRDDAFSVVQLTDAINRLKHVPGRIGQMGLFEETSVSTTSVAIEQRDGILALVAPSPRGGPGTTLDKAKRTLDMLPVPHFEINDAVMAEEVQSVREFGSESRLETVQRKIADRLDIHSQSLETTLEHARVGAVKGVITYADNSTLSLFTRFGVSQHQEVDFDLDNATPTTGALRNKISGVIRDIADELEGLPFTGIHAFCGDTFFDQLISHPEVRETYLGWQAAAELRGNQAWATFQFGGITWENYRGKIGGSDFIEDTKCHIFPVGVPGLFKTYFAPADYVETVNTLGLRRYAKQYEMPNGKGIYLDSQMNALSICTRPRVLIKGKNT